MTNSRGPFLSTQRSVRRRRQPWQVSSVWIIFLKAILILRQLGPAYPNKQRLILVFELVSWTSSKGEKDTDTFRIWFIWQSADGCFPMTGIASQKHIFLSKVCKSCLYSLIHTVDVRLDSSHLRWSIFVTHFCIFFCLPKQPGCYGANRKLKDQESLIWKRCYF